MQTPYACEIVKVADGYYFNRQLGAHNVWEIDVATELVDEAASLFYSHLRQSGGQKLQDEEQTASGVHHEQVSTPLGGFLVKRVRDWGSDISWISVDDTASFQVVESTPFRLPQT